MAFYISGCEQDTFGFAEAFAAGLKGGECVAVRGDLGAGKTVFAKGLAAGLGIKELVTSPTFVIMNVYKGATLKLYHFDMYRLNAAQAENLGFHEYFGEKDAVCLIEWPENVFAMLPKGTISLEIKRLDENTREIVVNE